MKPDRLDAALEPVARAHPGGGLVPSPAHRGGATQMLVHGGRVVL